MSRKFDKNKAYPKEVDLNYVFTDLAGKPIPKASNDPDVADANFTLKDAIIEGLTMPEPNNKAVDAKEKMKRWSLAQKVYSADKMLLSASEVVLIKDLVDRRFPAPLVVAQTIEQIDPVEADRNERPDNVTSIKEEDADAQTNQ